ncbi:MAG: hypothetical protein AMS18_15945 [Gemmatimonas sp. SG8_17]|nr:MAG: hypothetical protein AMS18_15945 [Gemmatimonas sp. SG8_17]
MEDILAITLIFGGGTLFLLSVSPIGRAIAERIKSGSIGPAKETLNHLEESQIAVMEELDLIRQELSEVQERVDFTERLLAKQRDPDQLPPG